MENTEFITNGKVCLAKLRFPLQLESTNHSIFSEQIDKSHFLDRGETNRQRFIWRAFVPKYTVSRYISFPRYSQGGDGRRTFLEIDGKSSSSSKVRLSLIHLRKTSFG
ncbi:hypothetical protein CDAR_402771 [Caerostris darwini]|uniref:Uncharacterized protein n=1 Tax=Caerostris darwini TaxID=1538125 RepID=A0AAV4N4N2_9ARAC|nr:hypothetical protein CDAR_402771 [Caerostris darwini]